jgi:hypothetical protein
MSTTIVAPKVRKIVGEIVSVSQLDDKDIVLVSIQNEDNEVVTVSTSVAYWKKVGKFFQAGSIIITDVEIRVKDTTEYEKDGAVHKHTSDGMNIVRVTAFSPTAWKTMMMKKQISEMETGLNNIEIERVGALAVFYGSALQALK